MIEKSTQKERIKEMENEIIKELENDLKEKAKKAEIMIKQLDNVKDVKVEVYELGFSVYWGPEYSIDVDVTTSDGYILIKSFDVISTFLANEEYIYPAELNNKEYEEQLKNIKPALKRDIFKIIRNVFQLDGEIEWWI
jgi:hypothetical protein